MVKLIAFSVALGALPLTSYYASLKYLWPENTVYAAILAVVAANIVLVSYIIVAALEDRKAIPASKPEETKKEK